MRRIKLKIRDGYLDKGQIRMKCCPIFTPGKSAIVCDPTFGLIILTPPFVADSVVLRLNGVIQ